MTKRNGSEPILEVRNLQTHFFTDKGEVKAVKGVSFSLENKQTLGIVGESGCGKSVTAHSIMQLIKSPPGKIVDGEIVFRRQKRRVETIDIVQLDPKGVEMRSIRGGEISMIFQEPMTSLNPLHTVGRQIAEVVELHQGMSRREALEVAIDMLDRVRIADRCPQLMAKCRQNLPPTKPIESEHQVARWLHEDDEAKIMH